MSGRGSRGGGGRGGRGGRGGGASRGRMVNVSMGDLTFADLNEMDKAKPNRHVYPPLEDKVVLSEASEEEVEAIRLQLEFVEKQRQTSWWPFVVAGIPATMGGSANTAVGATAAAVKRSSAYLPRYSDMIRRLAELEAEAAAAPMPQEEAQTTNGGGSQWQNKAFLDTIQVEAFPPGLWRLFTHGETKRKERREEAALMRKRKRSQWKEAVERVELAGNDAISDAYPSDDDGIEEGEPDEYEDDVEDDYADNYFDNGEDDDVPDEGGGGEAEDVYE